jgi:hypothetical protein
MPKVEIDGKGKIWGRQVLVWVRVYLWLRLEEMVAEAEVLRKDRLTRGGPVAGDFQ